MLRICQDIPEEVLRKSWELVLKNFFMETPKNSHKFSRHFLQFFCRIGNKKLPGIGYKKFLGPGYEKFLGMDYEKILWIAVDIFAGFSSEKFLGISADSLEIFLGFSAVFHKIVTWGGFLNLSLWKNSIALVPLLE